MSKETIDIFEVNISDPNSKFEYCDHCNGYGSSLKEEADTCTKCKGTGIQIKRSDNPQLSS